MKNLLTLIETYEQMSTSFRMAPVYETKVCKSYQEIIYLIFFFFGKLGEMSYIIVANFELTND